MKSPDEILKVQAADADGEAYRIDSLDLDVSRRTLQLGDTPIHLYPRAFDALVLLVRRRDRVVTKDDLMAELWPDVLVEENSIPRLISDLRKALGEAAACIVTVPRHGYRLDAKVSPAAPVLDPRRTQDDEAHSFFHRGRFWLTRRGGGDNIEHAIACFREAIARDPGFAAAHAALGEALVASSVAAFAINPAPPREAIPSAREAATRALKLDPTLGEAHGVLGHIAMCFDWDAPRALAAFETAIRLRPTHPGVRQSFAIACLATGDFPAALRELETARELDPTSMLTRANIGLVLSRARRPLDAIRELEGCVELDPGFAYARYRYALALQEAGRLSDAMAQFETMAKAPGARLQSLAALAHLHAAMGDEPRARTLIAELSNLAKDHYVSAWLFAEICAGLGDIDAAFAWLDRAVEERSALMIALPFNFKFDALKNDPRFAALQRRVGLWS